VRGENRDLLDSAQLRQTWFSKD